jgi:hypothetical protein
MANNYLPAKGFAVCHTVRGKMKKLLKTLKILVIIAAALAVLVCGGVFLGHKVLFKEETSRVPTIRPAQNAEFTLGVQARTQPETMDEYIELFARQVKRYNEMAPELWAKSALVNRSAVVEFLEGNTFWLISPDGSVTSLSKSDLSERGIGRAPYFNGFSVFDGGAYVAVSQEDLENCLLWQRYLHLGTYDPFITFAHESFHVVEQGHWASADHLPNAGARAEYFDNVPARAKRVLLQKQLLAAVADPGDTSLILDALATYEDYKTLFPDDYKNSVYSDRTEGTAYYYELISCLYASYPEKIRDRESLNRALALLATRDDIYVTAGLVAEGYHIGGFACVLLDRFENDWQERLAADAEMTPIGMLAGLFADTELPEPRQPADEEIGAVEAEINQASEKKGITNLFKMLYNLLF